MSHIHLSLGNDILRAEVRAHVACLANQLPNAEFNLVITGASLAALLGNTGDLMVNAAPARTGMVAAPASTSVSIELVPPGTIAKTNIELSRPAAAETGGRFRRTNEETAAGLTVEQAKAFRAQTALDLPAFAAFLAAQDQPPVSGQEKVNIAETPAEDAADTGPVGGENTIVTKPAETPAPSGPVVVTEQDVRDAAAKAVQCKRVDDVKKIAADYGVKNWKELDASKYPEVLEKLSALIVVG